MRIAQGKTRRRAAAMLTACALTVAATGAATGAAPARAADEGPSPAATATASGQPVAQQVAALRQQYSSAQTRAYAAYAASEGKPPEERGRIYQEKLPKPHPFAQKTMALARENPKDPAVVEALLFVIQLAGNNGASSEDAALRAQAIDQLSRDHLDDPRISEVFPQFMYASSQAGEKLMRLAAEKSTSREIRGSATFWLAQSLKTSAEQTGDAQKRAEAKKLYQQVDAEFADVKSGRGTLGERAKVNLFEIENLAIGKPAPDIEGKDANGKPLKLSDYRGKVVVLDFWGDW